MKTNKTISCLIVDDEVIAREVIATHLSKIKTLKLIASCSSAIEAFDYINSHNIDLIFLDINMPEITGISFAKSINHNIKIIFTTAYRDFAVEGFELKAVDYLLKPISFERLLKAVNNYFEIYHHPISKSSEIEKNSNFIFVRSERRMLKIDFNYITYIESLSDYLKIHIENKVIITRETITAIEEKLPKEQFLRIHRSYIVSLQSITSFTNEHIDIENKSLPISRSYKKVVLEQLEKY